MSSSRKISGNVAIENTFFIRKLFEKNYSTRICRKKKKKFKILRDICSYGEHAVHCILSPTRFLFYSTIVVFDFFEFFFFINEFEKVQGTRLHWFLFCIFQSECLLKCHTPHARTVFIARVGGNQQQVVLFVFTFGVTSRVKVKSILPVHR